MREQCGCFPVFWRKIVCPYRKSEVVNGPPLCQTKGLSAELAGSLRGSQPGYSAGVWWGRNSGGRSFPRACLPHGGLTCPKPAPAAPLNQPLRHLGLAIAWHVGLFVIVLPSGSCGGIGHIQGGGLFRLGGGALSGLYRHFAGRGADPRDRLGRDHPHRRARTQGQPRRLPSQQSGLWLRRCDRFGGMARV